MARARRKSAWDGEAGALEMETRTATSTQLPSVLTAETPGQRALSWPPLRSGLIDLMRRWDLLADRAFDDQRRNRSVRIRSQPQVGSLGGQHPAMTPPDAVECGKDSLKWRGRRPGAQERALAFNRSNSDWSMAPASNSSLALAICSVGVAPLATSRT
jgi:hypothetical protein